MLFRIFFRNTPRELRVACNCVTSALHFPVIAILANGRKIDQGRHGLAICVVKLISHEYISPMWRIKRFSAPLVEPITSR